VQNSTALNLQSDALLQSAGVAASAVQNSPELAKDPQLAHRGHFAQLEDTARGTSFVEATAINLSLTPGTPTLPPQPWAEIPSTSSTTCWATLKTKSQN
jgi:crotonobetainyl-CoA:carnitine CoA-transferase CaiB-like acyl-CoA transferase